MMDDPSGYLLYREVAKIYTTGIGAKQRRVQLERELDTMRLDKDWSGNCVTFLTKYSKTVDQHREMRGPHAHSDQFYIDKLDAAIAPHPLLGAYSSELEAGLIEDDAAVVHVNAWKLWADPQEDEDWEEASVTIVDRNITSRWKQIVAL